jgi:hypothetical protein
LEALNWMIHLAEKGLNGILAGASLEWLNVRIERVFLTHFFTSPFP